MVKPPFATPDVVGDEVPSSILKPSCPLFL